MSVSLVGLIGSVRVTSGTTLNGVYGQSPTGGNLLVACITRAGSSTATAPSITGASGWTRLLPTNYVSNIGVGSATACNSVVDVWYKQAAGGDAAPSFTMSGAGTTLGAMTCTIFELQGAADTSPLDVSGTFSSGASSGTIGSITTTTSANVAAAGEFAISVACRERAAFAPSITYSASWTNAFNDGSTSSTAHTGVAYLAGPSSGATSSDVTTFSSTAGAAFGCGAIVVVKAGGTHGGAAALSGSGTLTASFLGVTVDSVNSASTTSSHTALSWTHNVNAAATELLVAVGVDNLNNPPASGDVTLTVGGSSASQVTGSPVNNNGSGGLWIFSVPSPPTGSSVAIAATVGTNGGLSNCIIGNSISFLNSASLGTAVTVTGTNTGSSMTLTPTGVKFTSQVVGFISAGDDIAAPTTGVSQVITNVMHSGGAADGNIATGSNTGTGSVSIVWGGFAGTDTHGGWAVEVIAAKPPHAGAVALSGSGTLTATGGKGPFANLSGSGTLTPARTVAFTRASAMTGSGTLTAIIPSITSIHTDTSVGGWWVDQIGRARFMLMDNPWAIIVNAGEWNGGDWALDMRTYLQHKQAQGYTAVYVSALGNLDIGGSFQNGDTWDSIAPFVGGNPTTGLTSTYWQRVDYLIQHAYIYGITIILNIAYTADGTGHGTFDTGGCLNGLTQTQYTDYGTALANRYSGQTNLVWAFGNDYTGSGATANDTQFGYIWTAIQTAGDTHAMMVHNYPESTGRWDISNGGGGAVGSTFSTNNTQADFVYTYNVTYYGIEIAYEEHANHSQTELLAIWGDGNFWGTGAYNFDALERNMIWWAIASGARGVTGTSNNVWPWSSASLADSQTDGPYPWAGPIRTYLESLPDWQTLFPDTASTLVTSGRGTHASAINSGSNYTGGTDVYVAAAYTAGHGNGSTCAVIYSGGAFTITIDQTKMVPGYTAWWVDPSTAVAKQTATGSSYSSSGLGNNAAGFPDWALVLQAPPPGQGDTYVWQQPKPVPPRNPGFTVTTAPPPATTAHSGAAALTGSGTLTAQVTLGFTAALTGSGTLTAQPVVGYTAALTGSGTLTASAFFSAAAALTGSGTLTASPTLGFTAALTGSGTLTAAAFFAASASLSGSGTLTALGAQVAGIALLSGSGTLTAAATGGHFQPPLAIWQQPRQVIAVTPVFRGPSPPPSGVSHAGAANLSGSGTLTAAAFFSAAAALTGSGTLTASPTLGYSAALSGSGTLTAAAATTPTAALSGSGTLSAAPTLGYTAALSGSGTLTGSAYLGGFAALSGSGTITSAVTLGYAAALSGSGTLGAAAAVVLMATAVLSGSGTMTASATHRAAIAKATGTATVRDISEGAARQAAGGASVATVKDLTEGASSGVS